MLQGILKLPDGSELISSHRYDYRVKVINGFTYMIDGMGERTTYPKGLIVLDEDSSYEDLKKEFRWGTGGEWKRFNELSSDHLENILKDGVDEFRMKFILKLLSERGLDRKDLIPLCEEAREARRLEIQRRIWSRLP